MEQRITPYLLYEDGAAAIEFLTKAFGFREEMRTTGSAGGMHAELEAPGGGWIYLGQPLDGFSNPSVVGKTTLMYVVVDDVDSHYARATIQTVLTLRVAAKASWRRIGQRFLPADLPTRTTCREWAGAFAHASTRYLPAVLQHLARWASHSSALEVTLADLGGQPDPPSQLVAAVPHLLGGLREVGVSIIKGSGRWLATLWQWGNSRKLGRVV